MTKTSSQHWLWTNRWITIVSTLGSYFMLTFFGQAALGNQIALTSAVEQLLVEWSEETDRPFSIRRGESHWFQEMDSGRSCTSCHTNSLDIRGRHQKTGKLIEPMARSVNPNRLTDRKKINKWFLRNCKWTYGRICTTEEKGDILLWLSGQ